MADSTKMNWSQWMRTAGDWVDGMGDFLQIFGVDFSKGGDGKYNITWKHPPGAVEARLTEAKAHNIKAWVDQAATEGIVLPDGRRIDDDKVMRLLAQIPPDDRKMVYEEYDAGSLDDFVRALVRIEEQHWKLLKKWKPLFESVFGLPPQDRRIREAERSRARAWRREREQKLFYRIWRKVRRFFWPFMD